MRPPMGAAIPLLMKTPRSCHLSVPPKAAPRTLDGPAPCDDVREYRREAATRQSPKLVILATGQAGSGMRDGGAPPHRRRGLRLARPARTYRGSVAAGTLPEPEPEARSPPPLPPLPLAPSLPPLPLAPSLVSPGASEPEPEPPGSEPELEPEPDDSGASDEPGPPEPPPSPVAGAGDEPPGGPGPLDPSAVLWVTGAATRAPVSPDPGPPEPDPGPLDPDPEPPEPPDPECEP